MLTRALGNVSENECLLLKYLAWNDSAAACAKQLRWEETRDGMIWPIYKLFCASIAGAWHGAGFILLIDHN
jgi:hypothetical protein